MWKIVFICGILCWMPTGTSNLKTCALDITAEESRLPLATSLPYKPEMRVVGGQPAPISKYPYAIQVSMFGVVSCGGTLLTVRHVLTAAHCGYQLKEAVELKIFRRGQLVSVDWIRLRAGSAVPLAGGTEYGVAEFIQNPHYNKPLRDNDIAFFVPYGHVALRSTVNTATIAPKGYECSENATVTYIGWGYLGNALPQASSLQEVSVLVVNHEECRARYQALGNETRRTFLVTDNMFCAGMLDVGGRDACGGDSGGSVVEGGVVVGLISWGLLCADPTFPGVNINVARYFDWIDDTVKSTLIMHMSSDASAPQCAILMSLLIVFCIVSSCTINISECL